MYDYNSRLSSGPDIGRVATDFYEELWLSRRLLQADVIQVYVNNILLLCNIRYGSIGFRKRQIQTKPNKNGAWNFVYGANP
jgi:hypothetical protein